MNTRESSLTEYPLVSTARPERVAIVSCVERMSFELFVGASCVALFQVHASCVDQA